MSKVTHAIVSAVIIAAFTAISFACVDGTNIDVGFASTPTAPTLKK